jgi:hypothetical protein
MKYLKKFESIFEPDEPKQINQREWVAKMKSSGRDFFSKTEMDKLVNLMEDSGREHMQEEEWENLGWSEKMDKFHMGLTYLSFYIESDNNNPNPYGVDITKCKDEWFMVSFYQEDWEAGEEEEGYEEYYECDGFDCLLNLLKKEAKLK